MGWYEIKDRCSILEHSLMGMIQDILAGFIVCLKEYLT